MGYCTSLAIDSGGTPYIAYVDVANGSKASVMKFNGASWEQVGAAGFSAGQADYTSLAINSSGTPYIAYKDGANGSKASVMRYNSTTSSWEQVGTAGFSAGQADYTSLAINSGGTPYIAYTDGGNSNKASVMRYNSTTSSWEQVGTAGFSAGQADYTSLAINSGGMPYIAYTDGGNSYKTSVMRFNGTSWEQVGAAGFSAGVADFISLAINSGGTPYIAYRDGGNGQKASVMRYNFGHLPANTWLMTAPSCQPVPADIASQYGDDLSGSYGSTWIAYAWDAYAVPQTYVQLAAGDLLMLGNGSWLYSTSAGTLDLSGTATPTVPCSNYGSGLSGQCFAVDLAIPPAGQKRWNMVGHPFPYPVGWDQVRIAAYDGSTWTLYTPSGADAALLVEKNLYSWNGSSYQTKDDTPVTLGTLQPQEAVWVRSLAGASTLAGLKLLIPAR